jgi:hypothetical protein
MARIAFHQNDNLLEVFGLKDEAAGTFLNSATVTVTVTDLKSVQVTGETWPLAMAFVAGSNGDYRATLKDTLGFTAGQEYVADIIADGGTGLKARWKFRFKVRTRTG